MNLLQVNIVFVSGEVWLSILRFQIFYIMTQWSCIRLIVGDARFEYGTSVPEVIISCVTVTCSRVPWPTPRRRGSTSPPPTPPSTPASTSASSGTGHGLDHAVTYNCLHEKKQKKKLCMNSYYTIRIQIVWFYMNSYKNHTVRIPFIWINIKRWMEQQKKTSD